MSASARAIWYSNNWWSLKSREQEWDKSSSHDEWLHEYTYPKPYTSTDHVPGKNSMKTGMGPICSIRARDSGLPVVLDSSRSVEYNKVKSSWQIIRKRENDEAAKGYFHQITLSQYQTTAPICRCLRGFWEKVSLRPNGLKRVNGISNELHKNLVNGRELLPRLVGEWKTNY